MEAAAFAERVAQIQARADALNAAPGAVPIAADVVADLVKRHERVTRAYWAAEGRCMSSMITGPARFPVERNRKRMATSDRRAAEIRAHLAAALRRLERLAWPHGAPGAPIRADDPNALVKLRAELEDAKRRHVHAVEGNRLAKRKDWEGLAALLGTAVAAETRAYVERYHGMPFFPANRLANVKRIEARIASMERLAAKSTTEGVTASGVRVVENVEAVRLQLFFDGRPDAETIGKLKGAGFRWAPSEGAWQRQLTNNARCAAEHIVGKVER
jgi:hypothetical protein